MNDYIFNDAEKYIQINKTDLPTPWINYISNGHMHGFVSHVGGGTLWLENPARYKLTRYRSFNMPIDSPGFYIYIREKDGTIWSPTFRPAEEKLNDYHAEHMPGKSRFVAEKNGTKATLTLYIAPDYDICVWDLSIINNDTDKEFDVFAYMELSQQKILDEFMNEYYWRHMHKTWFDNSNEILFYLNHREDKIEPQKIPLVYFSSDRKVESYSGDRDAFMGNYRFENNPLAVENGTCTNDEINSGEACCALHIKLSCKKGMSENAAFFIGAEQGGITDFENAKKKATNAVNNLRNSENKVKQEEKLDLFWNDFLSKFECRIPDENAMRQINIWGPVASVHTARYSRCINVNAPGTRTLGYRDTCQDMFAMTYRDAKMCEDRLLYLLSKQYKAGNAIHCEGDNKNCLPDFKVRCDDHLWPSMLAYYLICETGDIDILNKKVCYLADDHMSEGEQATVWEHLLAAVEFTQNNLGAHGLPLTFNGDWNDIIHKFSENGLGESVFAGQQYAYVLRLLLELAKHIGDHKSEEKLNSYLEMQQNSILKNAWNGKWWYRCFDDDGNPIGSEDDEFGKIWINSQTWSVIGNLGTYDMQRKAMDEVNKRLDTGVGLMKLSPGFETWPKVKEPFSGYNPGTGENGAVFCHAHTWAVVAEAMLGNAELAWKYYNDLVPHNALNKVGLECYKSEPYTWCSNIVGYPNNKHGWGNISHISGTVTWMNVAATQYLLGVRPVLGGIVLDPCIPGEWDGYKVKRLFRGCTLNISFENPEHIEKGVKYIEYNGKRFDGNFIDASQLKDKKELDILVIMGK